ncbi:MAG: sugar phosphate isomerase/epimerase [Phycisphaeraceae bacterium]|nr:sugar phosphate isomerase/epimerase [Phycisphaeraceae bacterium]
MSELTRRRFMAFGAAALAAATCPFGGRPLFGEDHSPVDRSIEHYSGFKMGIQSYSLRHFNFADTVAHTADLGLHWIEFFPRHFPVTDDRERIAQVRESLGKHQIRTHVHGVHNFGGNAQAIRRVFQFAQRAGIPVLSAHPSDASFPILHDLVQEFDIRIGIHNHGPRHRWDRAEQMLEAVERWDKRIGFCPDTGHSMRSGENPVEVVRQLRERLYGMHLKDHRHIGRDEPPETILGEGAIDLEALCRTMREINFTGPISLEYELNPRNPIADIRKGLDNFAQAARKTR